MKKFIIIHKDEIVQSILDQTKTYNTKPFVIYDFDEIDTNYRIISTNNEFSDSLNGYRKLNSAELAEEIDKIRNSRNFNNKLSFPQTISAFPDAAGKRFRGTGAFLFETISNTTAFVDYEVTKQRLMDGCYVQGYNTNFGDNLTLQIVDKSLTYKGILYGADYNGVPWEQAFPNGVILDEFGSSWFVSDSLQRIELYAARILPGLFIRVIYNNVGENDSKLWLNLKLHQES